MQWSHLQKDLWEPYYPDERMLGATEVCGFKMQACANDVELVEVAAILIADSLVTG